MQIHTLAALTTLLASTHASISIGFGQQIIEHGGEENLEWVTWIHGESACPEARDLTAQSDNPCDKEFTHWGVTYKFQNCIDYMPSSVIDVNDPGNPARCTDSDNYKVHCHGDQHDIIQKLQCVN